jgi:hypothetical protein
LIGRELTDVFEIQDEIAAAIAAALNVPLCVETDNSTVHARPGCV